MTSRSQTLLTLTLIPALALAACKGDDRPAETEAGVDTGNEFGDSGESAGDGDGDGDGDGPSLDMPDDLMVVDLKIEPANAVIEIVDGVIPAQFDFTAIATNNQGDMNPVDANGLWSFDRQDLAVLDPSIGGLTATGLLGGLGTMKFTYQGLEAEAAVTVKLRYTLDPSGVDPAAIAALEMANTPDPSAALLYPYNFTVFPRGLLGPTVQWNGGNDGDIYQLHVESSTFELDWFGPVPNPSRWDFPLAPDNIWLKLTDSTEGDVSFELRRWDGATAYTSGTRFWSIAPANLAGKIYYWAVNQGDVLRIQPGAAAPEQFIQKPPGVTCVACHSVSRDGTTIVASQHGGYSPWATFNAEGAAIFASDSASGFQAISPDGAWVLWGQSNDQFYAQPSWMALSPQNSIVTSAQLFQANGWPVHPAWSNDGLKVAYGVRTDGNWLDFNNSTLWVVDVDTNVPAFSNPVQIVGNDPNRPTVSYPTWSPDSEWIAFGKATQARTREALGEMWMVRKDGSNPVSLDLANGLGHVSGPEVSQNYEPTFVPVASGGYFWLVYVSERTYGNSLTNQDPLTRNKQLWVTAININPQPGQDPSHPGFWLPGQEMLNNNMRGYAALNECKDLGEVCMAGYDCCGGYCVENMDGIFVCTDDPPMCSPNNSACVVDEDCCDPEAQCIGGFCSVVIG
jgi:cytochrome c5